MTDTIIDRLQRASRQVDGGFVRDVLDEACIFISNAEKRIEELETVCGESYQVVGVLASDAGVFGTTEVDKALTNLSDNALTHKDVLPFPSHPTRASELEQDLCEWKALSQERQEPAIRALGDRVLALDAYAEELRGVLREARAYIIYAPSSPQHGEKHRVIASIDAVRAKNPNVQQAALKGQGKEMEESGSNAPAGHPLEPFAQRSQAEANPPAEGYEEFWAERTDAGFVTVPRSATRAIAMAGAGLDYRYSVGYVGGIAGFSFFSVQGQGDTWTCRARKPRDPASPSRGRGFSLPASARGERRQMKSEYLRIATQAPRIAALAIKIADEACMQDLDCCSSYADSEGWRDCTSEAAMAGARESVKQSVDYLAERGLIEKRRQFVWRVKLHPKRNNTP